MLIAILLSSIFGSVHCLAMCGPLVGLSRGGLRLAVVHALGRLTTYAALGAGAGAIGSAIDLAGDLGAVQRAATLVAGTAILGWGLYQVGVAKGWIRARSGTHTAFTSALVQIKTPRAVRRAWLVGVLTGLLPCGWLWAFVVTAAGTGGVGQGVLVMIAFWLGTVPAMVGLLAVAGPVLARVRARLPAITAVVLIVLGLGTLALRWRDAGAAQVAHPHCHVVHA
jgi:sulfite exporter TauE/SafE